jgi:hypothetical protein
MQSYMPVRSPSQGLVYADVNRGTQAGGVTTHWQQVQHHPQAQPHSVRRGRCLGATTSQGGNTLRQGVRPSPGTQTPTLLPQLCAVKHSKPGKLVSTQPRCTGHAQTDMPSPAHVLACYSRPFPARTPRTPPPTTTTTPHTHLEQQLPLLKHFGEAALHLVLRLEWPKLLDNWEHLQGTSVDDIYGIPGRHGRLALPCASAPQSLLLPGAQRTHQGAHGLLVVGEQAVEPWVPAHHHTHMHPVSMCIIRDISAL